MFHFASEACLDVGAIYSYINEKYKLNNAFKLCSFIIDIHPSYAATNTKS